MSRFRAASITTAAILLIIAVLFTGELRWWLLAGTMMAYLVLVILGVTFIQMCFFCGAVCHGQRGKMQVALTFDDGPDARVTPLILDKLSQLKVPAAFFCTGEKILANPDLAKRICNEGHIIGNHTFSHGWWTNFLFGKYLFNEIERTQRAIKDAAGVSPIFFRPPAGLTNPHFNSVLKKVGLTMVGWSVRSLDRIASKPEAAVKRIINKTDDGSIIVLHDGGTKLGFAVDIVLEVVPKLRNRGYTFVRLDGFLGNKA